MPDDLVPLESVLLDEEEDLLFPDSVDFSDLKVYVCKDTYHSSRKYVPNIKTCSQCSLASKNLYFGP